MGPDDVFDGEGVSIRSKQIAYRASDGQIDIVVTIRNDYKKAVYLPENMGAPAFTVEKFIDGAWVPVYTPVGELVLEPPQKLEAGSELTSTFWIPYLRENDGYRNWDVNVPLAGTYRFQVVVQKSRGNRDNLYRAEYLPVSDRVSNTFEIEE